VIVEGGVGVVVVVVEKRSELFGVFLEIVVLFLVFLGVVLGSLKVFGVVFGIEDLCMVGI
jgi:hypothetical protein